MFESVLHLWILQIVGLACYRNNRRGLLSTMFAVNKLSAKSWEEVLEKNMSLSHTQTKRRKRLSKDFEYVKVGTCTEKCQLSTDPMKRVWEIQLLGP